MGRLQRQVRPPPQAARSRSSSWNEDRRHAARNRRLEVHDGDLDARVALRLRDLTVTGRVHAPRVRRSPWASATASAISAPTGRQVVLLNAIAAAFDPSLEHYDGRAHPPALGPLVHFDQRIADAAETSLLDIPVRRLTSKAAMALIAAPAFSTPASTRPSRRRPRRARPADLPLKLPDAAELHHVLWTSRPTISTSPDGRRWEEQLEQSGDLPLRQPRPLLHAHRGGPLPGTAQGRAGRDRGQRVLRTG